jgi:hypothetical protein
MKEKNVCDSVVSIAIFEEFNHPDGDNGGEAIK